MKIGNTTYNLPAQWNTYKTGNGQDANSIYTNPLLTPDYLLSAGSPCIDKGVDAALVTADFIGTLRPQGIGWDIGAYEFNPTSTSSETNFDKSFSIYPNPATDSIKINLTGVIGNQQIRIFNSVGELMKEFELIQSAQINISEFAKGVYLVQLKGFPEQTQKFIKQ